MPELKNPLPPTHHPSTDLRIFPRMDLRKPLHNLGIRLIDIDLIEAVKLSNRFNIYADHAYILACANAVRAPLLCLGQRMQELAQKIGIKVIEV